MQVGGLDEQQSQPLQQQLALTNQPSTSSASQLVLPSNQSQQGAAHMRALKTTTQEFYSMDDDDEGEELAPPGVMWIRMLGMCKVSDQAFNDGVWNDPRYGDGSGAQWLMIDRGSDENCCPSSFGGQVPVQRSEAMMVDIQGSPIQHHGQRIRARQAR